MKLSAINATILDTYPEIGEAGLQVHMGEDDHCKGDGFHMACPSRGLRKDVEHLEFIEIGGRTQKWERAADDSLKRGIGP